MGSKNKVLPGLVILSVILFLGLLIHFHILNRKTINNYSTLIFEKFRSDPKIIFIGDSRFEEIKFPEKLKEFRVVNLGVPGSNTQYWIDFFNNPFFISDDQKIVLWIGVNDFLMNRNAEYVLDRTVKLITELHANQIIFLNQIKVEGMNRTEINSEIGEFNKLLGNMSIEIIDADSAFRYASLEYIKSDGIHLTEKGNQAVIRLIKAEIEDKWK